MRIGHWVQGIMPMRHDEPEIAPDDRTLLLGASVETSQTLPAAPPVPQAGTIGHAHACMAYIGPDPLSDRAVGAWANVFPLKAEVDPKRGLGLRVIRDEQSRNGDVGLAAIDVVGLPVFDRAFIDGDEAIAIGTPHGTPAPVVMPIGGLPLALPLAEDAIALANYTTRAAAVTFDSRGVPGQIPAACRMSSALVVAARGGDNVAINGTRSGALIDLELARGGAGTIARGGIPSVETHRLDRVIVGGRGFLGDPHGDAAHISTLAPFISLADPRRDAPLDFEDAEDEGGAREGTIPHRVHLRHDEAGDRWRWHVAIPVYQDDDPPPENPPPPPPPEEPRPPREPPPEGGGDGTGGGGRGRIPPGIPQPPNVPLPPPETADPFPPGKGGLVIPLPWGGSLTPPPRGVGEAALDEPRSTAGSPHEWHVPGIAFRAVAQVEDGQPLDYRFPRGRLTRADLERARAAPVVLHAEGYGYETSGGRFARTDARGGARRYRYAEGTTGGVMWMPPEIGIEDLSGLAEVAVAKSPSTQYMTLMPSYVRLAFALPSTDGTGVKSGATIYQDGIAGGLRVDTVDSSATATARLKIGASGGVEIVGDQALTHNTAVIRRDSQGATDVSNATTPTAIYSYTIPLAALVQGTKIDLEFYLEKTGVTDDSFAYVYLDGAQITPVAIEDAYLGYTVWHVKIHLLTDGATADVHCHTERVHDDTPHPHADDSRWSTAVDLSAATALEVRVKNNNAADGVQGLGCHMVITTPS